MQDRDFLSLLGLLLLFLAIMVYAISATASEQRYQMSLEEGYAGLNFQCASSPVYDILREQTEYADYALDPNELNPRRFIVETDWCNLDIVYGSPEGDFVWRFTKAITDGHENHRHMTRGAYWVQLLDFEAE